MDNKVKNIKSENKIEYRFVPRTIYEDQMKPAESLQTFYKGMFDDIMLPR